MNVIEVTDNTFESEVLGSTVPVLVDFWAPWCPPCRKMGPVVDSIADELAGKVKVVKVNTEEAGAVAQKYGIMSIPTFLVMSGGKVARQLVGARSREDLVEAVLEAI